MNFRDKDRHAETVVATQQSRRSHLFHRKAQYDRRARTDLEEVEHDLRVYPHKYLFQRPQILQYREDGREVRFMDELVAEAAQLELSQTAGSDARAVVEKALDGPGRQRERIELFVDLIFVGVISNISEHFSQRVYPTATPDGSGPPNLVVSPYAEFILLFLPTWRIWNYLRTFMNHFFRDDALQRAFVLWILTITLVWGNNTPWALEDPPGKSVALICFLVARASFWIVEAYYCVFIPWLWKTFLLHVALNSIAVGLWIGAIFTSEWTRASLLLASMAAEYCIVLMMGSPLFDRFVSGARKISHDIEHFVGRLEAFFVLILGEGVMLLIRASPLGRGMTARAGSGCAALSLFFALHILYFRGDYSRNVVHAARRSFWRQAGWEYFHVVFFGNLFLLDVSMLYLISTVDSNTAGASTETGGPTTRRSIYLSLLGPRDSSSSAAEQQYELRTALWTSSISLALALTTMTLATLMNKSHDKPKTLLIDNRLVRLLPRVLVIIATLCIPIRKTLSGDSWLVSNFAMMWFIVIWEWTTSLDRDWGFFEPRDPE